MINKVVDLKIKNPEMGHRKIVQKVNDPRVTRYKVGVIVKHLQKYGEEKTRSLVWEEIFPSEAEVAQRKFEAHQITTLSRKNSTLKNQLKYTQKSLDSALKENDHLKKSMSFIDDVEDLSTTHSNHSIVPLRKSTTGAIPVLVASDWHVEEKVDPSTVNSLNTYTPEIARMRAHNFFRSGVHMINTFENSHHMDTAVLAVLGDMISGYIHEELQESNFLSPTEATLLVYEFLEEGIEYILENTGIEKLIVPCCFGNHGRTNKQKKISTSYQNSFEWMLYKIMEKAYADDPRVDLLIENGYHLYLELFDGKYKIRFHHGDSMRYGGGVGGITIPVNKAVAQWNRIRTVDLDVFGHFHQLIDNGNWICNGSLIGYNPFALSIKASYERPRQAFFLVDEKRGKTFFAPIYVEEDLKY